MQWWNNFEKFCLSKKRHIILAFYWLFYYLRKSIFIGRIQR